MNCAEFEGRLTALAAGEVADAQLASETDDLRRHAAGCGECGGGLALIELFALPAAERAPVPDPGPAYWNAFDARLSARILAAGAPRRPALRGAGLRRVAAAAALALPLLSGALWFWLRVPSATPQPAIPSAGNPAGEVAVPFELPGELAAMLDGLAGDRAADALAGLAGPAGLDDDWQAPDPWDPAADFAALMNGVDRFEQLAGLADWLPDEDAESLAVEAGQQGILSHGMQPFPDAGALGAEARKEFVRWIAEQLRPKTDLS